MLLYNYILDICKYIPSMILISSLSFGVIFNNIKGFIFFGLCLCCNIINVMLKSLIFKPFYYKFGNKNIPILGRGDRPRGHPKLDMLENYYNNSISFGMPSGHSQMMCFVATFWIIQIIYSKTKCKYENYHKLKLQDNISITYLILLTLLVMYSRYSQRYHTIQQVILGGIIGCCLGVLSFILFKKFFVKKKVVIKKKVVKITPTNASHETKILSNVNEYTRTTPLDKYNNEQQGINQQQFNNDINKVLTDMEFRQNNISNSNKLNELDEQNKTIKEYQNSPPIHKINIVT